MAPKREGLFEIEEVIGPVTYQLKLPETWKIHNVFHATLLRLYIENEIHGNNYPRPPPELLEGEEVYEVETILKHRRRGRGYQSNGKDIRSPKRHGNLNRHFPTMAICYGNTTNDINSEIKPSKLLTCHLWILPEL